MCKQMATIILTLIVSTVLVAQDLPIVNSAAYSKVYKGKEAAFEKAVSAHVSKWHGVDQWNQFGSRVMTGPRAGQYFIGTTNHYWKDYADRKTTKAHDDEWENLVNKHVEDQGGMTFFEKQLDASYNDRSAPMWEAVAYYTKPGKRGTMLEILKKGANANRRVRYDGSTGVYSQISGGEQNGILLVIYSCLLYTSPSPRDRG